MSAARVSSEADDGTDIPDVIEIDPEFPEFPEIMDLNLVDFPMEWTVCQRLGMWMFRAGYNGDEEFDAEVIGKGDDDATESRKANREFDPRSTEEIKVAPGLYVDKFEPQGSRLMLAISKDRKTWFKTGMVIVNCASVPCLAVEKDQTGGETLYLFFCAALNEITLLDLDEPVRVEPGRSARTTPLSVAYTTDLRNWTYRLIGERPRDYVAGDSGFIYPDLSGTDFGFGDFDFELDATAYSANDPSVVRRHDGSGWLMYYALHYGPEKRSMILVAETDHLYDFTWTTREDAIPVAPTRDRIIDDGVDAEDPNVGRTPMGYRLYASVSSSLVVDGNSWQADLDANGTLIEESLTTIEHTCDGDAGGHGPPARPVVLCNSVGGSREWLAFVSTEDAEYERHLVSVKVDFMGNIVGGTAESGDECQVLLERDQDYEYDGIREAAVARFGGCWVMVYSTGIPDYPRPGAPRP